MEDFQDEVMKAQEKSRADGGFIVIQVLGTEAACVINFCVIVFRLHPIEEVA